MGIKWHSGSVECQS